jgi:hypothetical protein
MTTITHHHLSHHEASRFVVLLERIWEVFWYMAPPIAFFGFVLYQLLNIPR